MSTDDDLPIRQRPGESDADYARRIRWTNVRPVLWDNGRNISNLMAMTYQVRPRDVDVR